ncbi:hypothetical protein [Pectobacterium sp. B2J-2]|uniref:hypothetical protein n=1 Tax=Pectobacterium sp. B2J-2 TaxID=3385372 RepID=UPI0038FCEB96
MVEKTLPVSDTGAASSENAPVQTSQQQPAGLTQPGTTDAQSATAHTTTHAQTLAPSQQNTEFFGEGLMNSPLSTMVVPAVLGVLIFFSVVTWATLLIKGVQFTRFRRQNKQFAHWFWKSANLSEGCDVAQQSQGSLARLAQVGIDVVCGNDIPTRRHGLAQQINRSERLAQPTPADSTRTPFSGKRAGDSR